MQTGPSQQDPRSGAPLPKGKALHIRGTVLLGIMLSIVTGVTLGASLFREHDRNLAAAASDGDRANLFNQLLKKVRSNYYQELTDEELLDGAFNGVMATLDEHSRYLDADDLSDLAEDTTGRFGGIGVEVGLANGGLEVARPMPDTPAGRAGVLSGDIIVGVDDYRIADGNMASAMERLRGAPGTSVSLHIERNEQALTIDLTRDVIRINSVRTRMLAPGYGYLRISQFRAGTKADVIAGLATLTGEAGDALKGLVLDLRNNPGGLLQSCIAVSDLFLERGEIVSTRGRDAEVAMKFGATPGDLLNGAPIVVLINGGSASAAEIVAGALQDNSRAVLLGTRSFGKGSVQTVMPVDNHRAIKLTTALYYTPNGRSIQKQGIAPDQEIAVPIGRSYESTLMDSALKNLQQPAQKTL